MLRHKKNSLIHNESLCPEYKVILKKLPNKGEMVMNMKNSLPFTNVSDRKQIGVAITGRRAL